VVQTFVDPARLSKRARSKICVNHFYIARLLLNKFARSNCSVPHVACLPAAHEHLPPGRCWMPCQICLGLPAARLNPASLLHSLPSLFTQPAYHEASPVMIQRGRGAGGSGNRIRSNNNNDNNKTTTTIIAPESSTGVAYG